jgi:hypothetical protein
VRGFRAAGIHSNGKGPLEKGAILFVFSFFIPRIIKKMKGE